MNHLEALIQEVVLADGVRLLDLLQLAALGELPAHLRRQQVVGIVVVVVVLDASHALVEVLLAGLFVEVLQGPVVKVVHLLKVIQLSLRKLPLLFQYLVVFFFY